MDNVNRLLEPDKGPAWLEFEVRMLSQFSSRGTEVRVPEADVNTAQ